MIAKLTRTMATAILTGAVTCACALGVMGVLALAPADAGVVETAQAKALSAKAYKFLKGNWYTESQSRGGYGHQAKVKFTKSGYMKYYSCTSSGKYKLDSKTKIAKVKKMKAGYGVYFNDYGYRYSYLPRKAGGSTVLDSFGSWKRSGADYSAGSSLTRKYRG